jgi:hypothetical protein
MESLELQTPTMQEALRFQRLRARHALGLAPPGKPIRARWVLFKGLARH